METPQKKNHNDNNHDLSFLIALSQEPRVKLEYNHEICTGILHHISFSKFNLSRSLEGMDSMGIAVREHTLVTPLTTNTALLVSGEEDLWDWLGEGVDEDVAGL
jgi:hypothetical protein